MALCYQKNHCFKLRGKPAVVNGERSRVQISPPITLAFLLGRAGFIRHVQGGGRLQVFIFSIDGADSLG